MADTNKKINFVEFLIESIRDDYRYYGVKGIIPWSIFFSVLAGGLSGYFSEASLWESKRIGDIQLLAAILTVNSILIALSWSSFSKIYEMASSPGFAKYLKDKEIGLLEKMTEEN